MKRMYLTTAMLIVVFTVALAQIGCPDSGLIAFWTFDDGSLLDFINDTIATNYGAIVCPDRCGRSDSPKGF